MTILMTIDQLTDEVIVASRNNEYNREVIRAHVLQGVYKMLNSGVKREVAMSPMALGFLSAYVTDVDNQASGDIKLSKFTENRLLQLSCVTKVYEDIDPQEEQ